MVRDSGRIDCALRHAVAVSYENGPTPIPGVVRELTAGNRAVLILWCGPGLHQRRGCLSASIRLLYTVIYSHIILGQLWCLLQHFRLTHYFG